MPRIKRILMSGFGSKAVALFAAVAFTAMLPYGCSKQDEKAGAKKAPETTAEQQAGAEPAQEHFNKGVQHSLAGDYDAAIEEYEKTIEYNPQSAEAYNNMGFAYFDKGDIDKAIEIQKKALEINPHLPNGYYGLALALEKKGDEKGAIENWKAFIQYAEPHSKWWLKAKERIGDLDSKNAKGAEKAK
ncbi:MAG: tetratricopeptide repeat protein [Thermodesulfobacteriota bacterium]